MDPDQPRRWIRGFVNIKGSTATVEVNSKARLDAISAILAKAGAGAPVVERVFNPALDLAVPAGWRPFARSGSPEAEVAWRSAWLDTELPALEGSTPREAAAGEFESQVLLERLLRRFEFDEDLTRAHGRERPISVSAIRCALGDDGREWEL